MESVNKNVNGKILYWVLFLDFQSEMNWKKLAKIIKAISSQAKLWN